MVVTSSAALNSASALTTVLSLCRGLDSLEAGPLICSARVRSVLAVLGPPGLCLSHPEVGSWAASLAPFAPRACAVGFTLLAGQPPLCVSAL